MRLRIIRPLLPWLRRNRFAFAAGAVGAGPSAVTTTMWVRVWTMTSVVTAAGVCLSCPVGTSDAEEEVSDGIADEDDEDEALSTAICLCSAGAASASSPSLAKMSFCAPLL